MNVLQNYKRMKNIKKAKLIIILYVLLIYTLNVFAQPNWTAIKDNATFIVPDTSYETPYIQPLNIGGWEDGLFISRDGLRLYSYFLPFDVFSLYPDWALNPVCFNSQPYYRPPLLDNDTVSNPWGCPNFFQGDIIISTRNNVNSPFIAWQSSNLIRSISNEGAPCGISKNADSLDVFVFTQNRNDIDDMEIMFLRNVPNNPSLATAVSIFSTTGEEDNPHIERLNDTTLLIIFDRDRYMYYSLSEDNGNTWLTPVLITQVLNDQSPYDVQPHLWNDGTDWWIYFCADNVQDKRCIYKSRQQTLNDWDSWGPKELMIEPAEITGGYGTILGVGEPTLTQWGDISFVVIYGDLSSTDTTDMFDCDPWLLPKIGSPLNIANQLQKNIRSLKVFPNPASDKLVIKSFVNKPSKLNIYNSMGVLVKIVDIDLKTEIDISNLPNGMYFIQSQENPFENIKFVKN